MRTFLSFEIIPFLFLIFNPKFLSHFPQFLTYLYKEANKNEKKRNNPNLSNTQQNFQRHNPNFYRNSFGEQFQGEAIIDFLTVLRNYWKLRVKSNYCNLTKSFENKMSKIDLL